MGIFSDLCLKILIRYYHCFFFLLVLGIGEDYSHSRSGAVQRQSGVQVQRHLLLLPRGKSCKCSSGLVMHAYNSVCDHLDTDIIKHVSSNYTMLGALLYAMASTIGIT